MNRTDPAPEKQALTLQQALDLAIQYHTTERLPEAKTIYQQILQTDPNHPIALHLLGVISYQIGENDRAVDLITKALTVKLDFADAHCNLGNALNKLGRLDEAVTSYHKAIEIKPDYAEAHYNLGILFRELGRLDEAIVNYHKAIQIKPDYAEAHNNLGNALNKLGRLDEAIACYYKALAIEFEYAEAHGNLGAALQELGRPDEAVTHCRKAIEIKPDYAAAFCNLGAALQDLGKPNQAIASYREALAIIPNYAEAYYNLGFALEDLDRDVEAKAAIDQGFHINHGGPWWNAESFAEEDSAGPTPNARVMFTSTFKLQDTVDQLEYLITKGRIDPSFQRLTDRYRTVLAEMQLGEKPDDVTNLTPSQLKILGSSYNRVIYYSEAPRLSTGAVNGSLDFNEIEDCYLSSPVSVTALDDFLMPEALLRLRKFCLESTIFFTYSGNRFVESKLHSGFNCDLLYQMIEELKGRFPRVLADHHLANMWIYRYNNQSVGVYPHTDKGAVTFNFWITPDDANLMPDRGGLIVYTKEQPYDWDWRYYNRNKNTPAVSQEITNFLAEANTVTIPYRENRAVMFRSNLFHKSDEIQFRDGFENRRMNITLLFGKREA